MQLLVMYNTLKYPYCTAKLCVLTGLVPRINFFNERCNKLVVWLKNRGYNEKLVRQQILKARNYRRTELLYSQREQVHRNKLVLKISYPIASKLHNILSKNSSSFTPDKE